MSTINVNRMVDSQGGVLAPSSSVMRNRIINGGMTINQRALGTTTINSGSAFIYTVDRWNAIGESAAGVFTVQQSSTAPVGFTNSFLATVTTASTPASGNLYVIRQAIEGNNLYDLGWGTANAKTVTLSFQVYSSLTGTFGGTIQNGSFNRSYPFTYTVSSANTWTPISITIAGDTSGTWAATTGIGMNVIFSLGAGSSVSGTAGSWAGASYYGATGQTNIIATNGATFYITGVQLEKGTQATSFEYRQYGQELALCQRYFEQSNQITEQFPLFKFREVDRIRGATIQYKVEKRATPTITLLGANGDGGGTPTASSIGLYACRATCLATADGQAPWVNGYSASAEL